MERVVEMANEFKPWLKFMGITVGTEIDNMVPMLDAKLRIEHGEDSKVVWHFFYEKPCTLRLVMMSKSAMSAKVKMKTLANEMVRRMHNSDRLTTNQERAEMICELMDKICRSGYPPAQLE